MKNKNNKWKRKALLVLLALFIIPFVLAQNDPGHDALYIEEEGDSDLNGTLNITHNLTVNGGRIRQPGGLVLYGDDSTPAPGVNYISGTSSDDIYIDGQGNIYIKFLSGGDMVYIGGSTATDLNISGAMYFGGNNELDTSAAGTAASSDLYWGDKLLCNTSESDCGWLTTATGGDITSVQDGDKWLDGGADTGAVTLTFNESEMNDTIDERSGGTDDNNYTESIGFSTSGATETLNLKRYGMSNLTASFTDTDSNTMCDSSGVCSQLYIGTNELDDASGSIAGADLYWGNDLVCNFDEGDTECGWVGAVNTNDKWLDGGATYGAISLTFNESEMNDTIDARSNASGGGWTDLGTTINLTTPSDNVSINTLFIDNTNSRVGIGTASPSQALHVVGHVNMTGYNISTVNCIVFDSGGKICTGS